MSPTSLAILERIEDIYTSTDMGETTVGVFIVGRAILVDKIRGLANKMVV